jgi:hypothetical protein
MFSKLRSRRPSHATVVAYVALFVALGGTSAYAAATIDGDDVIDESLTSDDLANDKAVQGSDVIDGSLVSADVLDGSLAAADLANSAVTNSKIRSNAVTGAKVFPSTLTGGNIASDSLGSSDIGANAVEASELTTINDLVAQVSVPPNSGGSKLVTCLPGEQVISGGYTVSASTFQVLANFRNGNGWEVSAFNPTASTRTFKVHAYCLAE